jgi:hypothetical protein
MLATGFKVHGFKPSRGDRFLRMIKIRSTPSFREEVKPETPNRKILRHVKKSLASINRNTSKAKFLFLFAIPSAC